MIQMNAGIYKLTNSTTGKIYIGESFDLNRRKQQHFEALDSRTHHNPLMQEDYNKGCDFTFEVLEYLDVPYAVRGKAYLLYKEAEYIGDKYDKYNHVYSFKDYINKKNTKPIMPNTTIEHSYNALCMVRDYGVEAFNMDEIDYYYSDIDKFHINRKEYQKLASDFIGSLDSHVETKVGALRRATGIKGNDMKDYDLFKFIDNRSIAYRYDYKVFYKIDISSIDYIEKLLLEGENLSTGSVIIHHDFKSKDECYMNKTNELRCILYTLNCLSVDYKQDTFSLIDRKSIKTEAVKHFMIKPNL